MPSWLQRLEACSTASKKDGRYAWHCRSAIVSRQHLPSEDLRVLALPCLALRKDDMELARQC